MLKRTMKFLDYKGVERSEDHYFNLSKADIAKMELSEKGGLAEKIHRVAAAEDGKEIIKIVEDMIKTSYGVISPDGREFIKNEEVWLKFYQTEAYSDLFVLLCTDPNAAAEFVNGIIPQGN